MNRQPSNHSCPGAARRPLLGLLGALLAPAVLTGVFAGPASARELPISPSEYGVSALCSTPAPGYSGCLGLRLVADDPASVPNARVGPGAPVDSESESASQATPGAVPGSGSEASEGVEGVEGAQGQSLPSVEYTEPIRGSLSPSNILSAYNLTGATPPTPQTIALVDAYDDATIEHDLDVFDKQFGLPTCSSANGCFRKVDIDGFNLGLGLDELEHLVIAAVVGGGDEHIGHARTPSAAGTADAVDVILGMVRYVVVEDVADSGNIEPARGDV